MLFARSSAFAGLLLVAAGAACGAEDAGGALDGTKQELRQLQTDQKNKAGQAGDKLKLSTPTIDIQTQDADSSQAWLSDKLKQERKLKERKEASKNWLVDGVEKLEKEGAQSKEGATAAKDGTAEESKTHEVDPSDPQYLLKLFDEQKKTTDGKSSAAHKSPGPASPDPFAPFLQSWLGSSPVRGQFFDQSIKKPDGGVAGGASPVIPTDYRGPAGPGGASVAPQEVAVADKGNPYLAELNAPVLAKEVTGGVGQLQSMGAPSPGPEPAKGGPVLLPSDPVPDNRERAKAPLPGLADEKKYFPQLKRF